MGGTHGTPMLVSEEIWSTQGSAKNDVVVNLPGGSANTSGTNVFASDAERSIRAVSNFTT